MPIKTRLVKTEEVDNFLSLLRESNKKIDELKRKSNFANDKMKVSALFQPVEALTNATIEMARLKSEFECLLLKFQEQIEIVLGIKPSPLEKPYDFFERVGKMSQQQLVWAVRANNIVWESWLNG